MGGPYICRGCGVHHTAANPCELELEGGKHGYEVADTAGAARRFIRKLGQRIGGADPVDLQLLLELRAELDAALLVAMRGQHAAGFSYAAIAEGMGTGRQAVYERLKVKDKC